jgi:hypothetical protein
MPAWVAGHLLVVLVSGFALSGAVESQDGVDANFPDSLGDCGLLGTETSVYVIL